VVGVFATAKLRVGVNWWWFPPLFLQTLKKYKKFYFIHKEKL
jgi:hypothetical protein